MRADRLVELALIVGCCAMGACSVERSQQSNLGFGGAPSSGAGGQAGRASHGGTSAGGRGGAHSGGEADTAGEAGSDVGGRPGRDPDLEAGAAGMAGEAGGGSLPEAGPPTQLMPGCTADAGCTAKPVCASAGAHCAIESTGACEFDLALGDSADVACGEAVTVARVACGDCGPIAVELYFDGTNCWEGLPDCVNQYYAGVFVDPHPPSQP